jgi:hypothetical protein
MRKTAAAVSVSRPAIISLDAATTEADKNKPVRQRRIRRRRKTRPEQGEQPRNNTYKVEIPPKTILNPTTPIDAIRGLRHNRGAQYPQYLLRMGNCQDDQIMHLLLHTLTHKHMCIRNN